MNQTVPISDFLFDIRTGKFGPVNDPLTYEKYFFNIKLCAGLYPIIRLFESVLRNKMDIVLSRYIGENWIFEFVQNDKLLYQEKYIKDRQELVNVLPFYFWCKLFQKHYQSTLWNKYPNAMRDIFEKCASKSRLNRIAYEIEQIRKYRNLIAHNGIILPPTNEQIQCDAIYVVLCRLIKEMGGKVVLKQLKNIDCFDDVLKEGIQCGLICLEK